MMNILKLLLIYISLQRYKLQNVKYLSVVKVLHLKRASKQNALSYSSVQIGFMTVSSRNY